MTATTKTTTTTNESSRRYHRRSTLINATSILGTYEIGNPPGRNYSNNVARSAASTPAERAMREKERCGEKGEKREPVAEMDARKCSAAPRRTSCMSERDADKGSLSRAQRRGYHRSYPPPLSVAVDLRRLSRRPVIAIVNRRFVALASIKPDERTDRTARGTEAGRVNARDADDASLPLSFPPPPPPPPLPPRNRHNYR